MITPTRIIIEKKDIVSRKIHTCFVCNNRISKNQMYIYDKCIDTKKKMIFERRRHLNCSDPEQLKTKFDIEGNINIKELINSIYKRGNNGIQRKK